MYGLDFTRNILQSAIPYATLSTAGNIAEARLNKTVTKVIGNMLQIFPVALCLYDALKDIKPHWTPIITSTIASTVLLAPLVVKGLETVAHKYHFTRIEACIANTDWLLIKVIKVVTLCFYALGTLEALSIASPVLVGVYSLFFLGNLYLFLTPQKDQVPASQTI